MQQSLVLTIISEDKPGLVESLSQTIAQHGGNWLESRMAQLSGKFAGILRVSVHVDQTQALQQALKELSQRGIQIMVEEASDGVPAAGLRQFRFSVVGDDRPGIVSKISRVLANHQVNVTDLTTHCSSAPHSGETLFHAGGLLQVPAELEIEVLEEEMEQIADDLIVEIALEAVET